MDATPVICTREEAQYKNMQKVTTLRGHIVPTIKGDYLNLATCWGLLAVRKRFQMVVLKGGYPLLIYIYI